MAGGTWAYTKRWDLTTAGIYVQAGHKAAPQLLYEQTLVGGFGDVGDALKRYNDADAGVSLPNGIKRLAMCIRTDSLVGGANTDICALGIDVKPQSASRFYTLLSANTSRFIGGSAPPAYAANQIEVWGFDGKLSTSGAAFREWVGAAPATEAGNIVNNTLQIGWPLLLGASVRTGWAFSHTATNAGRFNFTVQMWGIYDA